MQKESLIKHMQRFLPRGMSYEKLPPSIEELNPLPGIRNQGYSDVWRKTDEEIKVHLIQDQKFKAVKKLEDGSWVGLYPLAYTLSVCCDITPVTQYAYRWCFKDPTEAVKFFNEIKEFDDIPIKRDSLQGHRFNNFARLMKTDELGLRLW